MLANSFVASLLLQCAAAIPFEAPVSADSLTKESAYLKAEADKADVNNAIVKKVLGNGFQSFQQDAMTATYTYEASKSEQLVPFIQQVVGATDAVKDDVAASIIGAEWVTDGGGVKWNHHTLLYTASDQGSQGSMCNYATFIVRIPPNEPTKRELFVFHQKTTFSLAPDVIFLRVCTTSAGFMGIGKHTHCHNVPKSIPHSLDEASLEVLQDYLTAVAFLALAPDIPAPSAALSTRSVPLQGLPAEFEATLAALRARVQQDIKKVHSSNSSTSSEVVKELLNNGFDKWESTMTMQTMNRIAPQGAPVVLKMMAKSSSTGQSPEVQAEIAEAFDGILTASDPLVYTTLGCSGDNTCSYLFIMGRTVDNLTDLVVVRENAPFKLAPKLVVVRETKHNIWNGTTVTDKVKEVPQKVTQKDLDGILAFFEVSVVQTLSQQSGRFADCELQGVSCASKKLSATPPTAPPKMPGGLNAGVDDWQKIIDSLASDPKLAGQISAGQVAADAAAGAIGYAIAGPLAFIPLLIDIFHTSHSHSDNIIGTLTGKGFTHISMEQFGPNSWKNLPYKSGDNNPVKIVMDLILKAHLSDFGDAASQTDIQTYAEVLVNGWSGGSNQWTHQNIIYSAKNGGGAQALHLMSSADLEKGTADIMFWKTKADIKLAPNFIIHRITDTSANIFHSSATQRDVLVKEARDITKDDITALYNFFDIMALKTMSDSLQICSVLAPGMCNYPKIPTTMGNASTIFL